MSDREQDALVEAAVSAHRERDPEGRLQPPAEWWDLPAGALDELFVQQVAAREVERVMDRDGRSTTVEAVIRRIRSMGR